MSRVRLTARGRSAADQTPYPGNVNQPDRSDPSWEQYHTFEQKVNHELPDMRHQWQDDSRDDIGFGIPEAWGKQPTLASVRVAANKSVRIAMLLMGDKVSDEVIEAQATDFMAMGQSAMDRTLSRFADSQKLYAEDEEEKVEEKVEEKKEAASEAEFTPAIETPGAEKEATSQASMIASVVAATLKAAGFPFKKDDNKNKKSADETEEKVEEVKAADEKVEEKVEEKKEEVKAADEPKVEEKKEEEKACTASELKAMIAGIVASTLKAALPDFIKEKQEEKKEEVKAADETEKVEEKKEEVKAADETEKVEEVVEEKKASAPMSATEFDIELTGAMEDEVIPDKEADERLASIFDNDGLGTAAAEVTSGRKTEASQKKTGISKLGGQPRVASTGGAGVDISSIWQSAPDVSEAFR
jgi:hypothetical protein